MPKKHAHWMDVVDELCAEKLALELENETLKVRIAQLELEVAQATPDSWEALLKSPQPGLPRSMGGDG